MMKRISEALQIRPGEGLPLVLLFFHSCMNGMILVLFETAASALYLNLFGVDSLPWVYIIGAGVVVALGLAYDRIEKSVAFATLARLTLAFLLVATVLFRLGLWFFESKWIAMALMIWTLVVQTFIVIEFWGLAGKIFNVREGKRLFGLVASGEEIAATVSGLSVPLLVGLVGTQNLLLLVAIGLATSMAILDKIVRTYRDRVESEDPDEEVSAEPRSLVAIFRFRYMRLFFFVSILSVFGFYFAEFAFFQQVEAKYADADELAAFLGVFAAIVGGFNLVCGAVLTGRLLTRYGLSFGLTALPAALLAGGSGIAVAALTAGGTILFWSVVATKFLDDFLRPTLDEKSGLILYQPLPPSERVTAQTKVQGIVEPAAISVAGLLLLVFTSVMDFTAEHAAWLLIIVGAVWLYVAWNLRQEYNVVLAAALARRALTGQALTLTDASSLEVLKRGLGDRRPMAVLFAMSLIDRAEHPEIERILVEGLAHESAEVRRDVLDRIEARGIASATPIVSRLMDEDPDPAVRAAALRCWCVMEEGDVLGRVEPFLRSEEPAIRRAAIVGLLRRGEIEGIFAAGEPLTQMLRSSAATDRRVAAEMIGEVGIRGFDRPILRLLRDPDPGVRRTAAVAAGRIRNPRFWPGLIALLDDPVCRGAAAAALAAGGGEVVPALERALDTHETSRTARLRIVRVLGRVGGAAAQAALWRRIEDSDSRMRSQVVSALAASRFASSGAMVAVVERLIRTDVRALSATTCTLADLGSGGPLEVLREAIECDAARLRARVLRLLSLLYPTPAMRRARLVFECDAGELKPEAIELLDNTLARELKEIVLPLVDDIPPEQCAARLAARFPVTRASRGERLRELMDKGDGTRSSWTRALAIFSTARVAGNSMGHLAGSEYHHVVVSAASDSDEIVRETARLALDAASAWRGERRMFTLVEKTILLKTVEIFSEVADDLLAEIAAVMEETEAAEGETIVEKGDLGCSMFVIVEGRVRVHDGDRVLAELSDRDVFGELALLDPEPRFASVTAVESTTLLRLHQDTLYELMFDHVEVAHGIIRILCRRLRRAKG